MTDEDFDAWKAALPSGHWAKYDLSACRLGFDAGWQAAIAAERAKQAEPVAWREQTHEIAGIPRYHYNEAGSGQPLYAAPPAVRQQAEPVGEVVKDPFGPFLGVKFAYPGVCSPGQKLYAAPPADELALVVTCNEAGQAVSVTRQDCDGQIHAVLWEAPPAGATK